VTDGDGQAVLEVTALDAASPERAADLLRPCCASSRWVAELAAGRPFGTLARLLAASDAAMAGLSWSDIGEALAAHPRIGERAAGTSREAAWSRGEQSGAADAGAAARDALAAGNVAYEQRFGHVFLIRAAGRSAAGILAELRQRLEQDEPTERETVRSELAQIAALRLAKTFR
jgi:2-oxo-4-hydroxy-4-carboxy-5-ureidoimidazoline decarboxylase